MEIEVRKLNALKKYTGCFSFEYEPPADMCLVPLCKLGKVSVSGDYEIYDDDSVGVKLNLVYEISGQCSYCLSEAKSTVSYSTEILYLTEKNGEDYYYDGNKINLKEAVNDAILISQPNILLCKEDCKGIDFCENKD